MNAAVQRLYDQLEKDRLALFDRVVSASDEKLNAIPGPGKWSVNQILIHLLTSERLTLLYLKKKSQGKDGLKNSGLLESLKLTLLIISQRLPGLKFKAPKGILEKTPLPVSPRELIREWDNSRLNLRHFLETVEEKDLHKLIFRHPVAGMLDVKQCLIFMREHFHHHLPQINRIL